jgi:F-type H+-transporting ATPase subunit epsilon
MVKFELVTLNGIKYSEEAYEVQLPTPQGYVGIFPHHAPLVTLAVPGVISVRAKQNQPDDLMEHFATNGGVIEVSDDTIRVLVDEADAAEEINEAEIQKALEHAKKLRAEAKDQVSLDHAQSLIDRQAVRLQVAGLKRRRRSQYK